MNVRVTPLEKQHIDKIVQIHIRAFPTFFLSFLGPRFLREFYRSFLDDPMGIGLVAVDGQGGQVLGAVVGPLRPAGYFKRLLVRRWWAFCLASISAVVRSPSAAKRLVRAVFYRGEGPSSGPERSLLSSVAVDPDCQGLGIGATLVRAWVEESRKRGSQGAFLTTDASDNEAVNRFYQKLGWVLEATYETPEGRKMNRYVMDCGSDPDRGTTP